jgi:hypothetical protein
LPENEYLAEYQWYKIHHKAQLEQFEQDAELERQRQKQDAQHQRQLLLDAEQQQQEQFVVESRLHGDKIKHENYLNDITLDVQLQAKQAPAHRFYPLLLASWLVHAHTSQYRHVTYDL